MTTQKVFEIDNWKITNNDVQLLDGDEMSIKMIFNNLAGRNFYGVLYYMWLQSLGKYQGLKEGKVSLIDDKGITIDEAVIEFGLQPISTTKHKDCYQ